MLHNLERASVGAFIFFSSSVLCCVLCGVWDLMHKSTKACAFREEGRRIPV